MAVIRNLVVKIGADISGLSKGLKSAQQQLEKVSREISKIGKSFSVNITAPFTAFATLAVKASSDLETSMLSISKSFDTTGKSMEEMTDLAKKMSKTTIYSVSEVASAMNYMSKAGFNVAEMEKSLATLTNLATGAQVSLDEASEDVIKVLEQYNLTAQDTERVANVMASALSNSQMSIDELTTGLAIVGRTAVQCNTSIESVAGALAMLSNAGYDGEEAGSYLKGILQHLKTPSKEATKALAELGLTVEDISPETNSLVDIVKKFADAGLTSAQATEIFGENIDSAFMSIVSGGADALERLTKQMSDLQASEQLADKYNSTLTGQLKQIQVLLNDIATQFGDVLLPIIKKFLEGSIIPLIQKFSNLSEKTKEIIVKVGLFASTIGPAVLIVAKVVKTLGSLSGIFSMLTNKIGLIIAVIGVFVACFADLYKTNAEFRDQVGEIWNQIKETIENVVVPLVNFLIKIVKQAVKTAIPILKSIIQVVVGVVGQILNIFQQVADALSDLWNNNEKFRDGIVKIWTQIQEVIERIAKLILDVWNKYGERIFKVVSKLLSSVLTLLTNVLSTIVNLFSKLFDAIEPIWDVLCDLILTIVDVVTEVVEFLEPIFSAIIEMIAWLVDTFGDAIAKVIDLLQPFIQAIGNVLSIITNVVQAIVALFKGDFTGAFDHIKNVGQGFADFFSNIISGVANLFKGLVETVGNLFSELGQKIGSICLSIYDNVTGWFSNIWSGIKSVASGIWDTITGVFGNIGNWFKNLWNDAFNWGKNMVNMIGDGIKSGINKVKDACSSVIGKIKGWLGFGSPTKEGPGKESDHWAPNLMEMYAEGIETNIPEIQSAVDSVAEVLNGMNSDDENAKVTTGETSISSEILNGLLTAMNMNASINQKESGTERPIELSIDGSVFARLIYPKIVKEFQRNGVLLTEGVKT